MSNEFFILFITKLIHIIEHIHSNYVIHRDIKPENIMVNSLNEPIIIDFGLSCFYYSSDGEHIKNNKINSVVGSHKYCSIYVNSFNTPSRRDDIISISYILIFWHVFIFLMLFVFVFVFVFVFLLCFLFFVF